MWAFCATTKLIEMFETSEPYISESNPNVTSYQLCVFMDKVINFLSFIFLICKVKLINCLAELW